MKKRIIRYFKEATVKEWISNIILVAIILILAIPSWRLSFQKAILNVTLGAPKPEKIAAVETIPDHWTFYDREGKTISFGDFEKEKIFINFWASWCAPCMAELPSLVEAQKKLKDDVQFIFLNSEPDEKTESIISQYPETSGLFLRYDSYPEAVKHNSIPYSVWIKNGVLHSSYMGAAKWTAKHIEDGFN